MVLSNVIVDITISSRSFVFSQSDVQVSAGLTNVSGLAVAAFDFVNCSPSVARFASMQNIEERALATYKRTLPLWLRYVDDTFTAVHKDEIDDFNEHLNGQNADIQFTKEIEENDDFRSGCRNVSQCHLKQSFSGLHSPGRSQFTEL